MSEHVFEVTPREVEDSKGGRSWYFWALVGLGVLVAVFILGLIAALLAALLGDPDDVANWVGIVRDIFIIVLALEGLLMGIALIVLVIQVAALINLLQNEVQPIVENAQETVTTVRGTAQFMSQNVVEPVVKFSAAAALAGGFVRQLIGIRKDLRSGNGRKAR